MNNVYDNGEMVLGSIYNVKEYICRNADDIEEVKDIIEDLENYDDRTIVAVNYDLGMGYSIDYWDKDDIVYVDKGEYEEMKKEQLIERMYNYYKNGINSIENLLDLKKEIRDNLETLNGVEDELESIRTELKNNEHLRFEVSGVITPFYEDLLTIEKELIKLREEKFNKFIDELKEL